MPTNPEPYKTSDTPYAAFLHMNGVKLVTTRQDPNDIKREVIVFLYDDNIKALEQEWRNGASEQVRTLKTYYKSYKIIGHTIKEARKGRG